MGKAGVKVKEEGRGGKTGGKQKGWSQSLPVGGAGCPGARVFVRIWNASFGDEHVCGLRDSSLRRLAGWLVGWLVGWLAGWLARPKRERNKQKVCVQIGHTKGFVATILVFVLFTFFFSFPLSSRPPSPPLSP